MPRAFVIHSDDNVATALEDLPVGEVALLGETNLSSQLISEPIKLGHKLVLKALQPGDLILKYEVEIGEARKACQPGDWLHLQNVKSRYDKRSNTFDVDSGAPTEENIYQ